MKPTAEIRELLLDGLTEDQQSAVMSPMRRVLVVAGAGSGKTEVMARRIAWWVGVEEIPKDQIVAFTFTEKAAEEMKFRIRRWIERISEEGETITMGGMYIGTIHGFCLLKLREFWADDYHNYDIIDETGREALIQRGFYGMLNLRGFKDAIEARQFETSKQFQAAYDILHEYNMFDVLLPEGEPPIELGQAERDWCEQAELNTDVGQSDAARMFAVSAARYYAYIRCRRFLDFSTSQSEFIKRLIESPQILERVKNDITHLVVDEVQDVNPVQDEIIRTIVGERGNLTIVGDHRQAIYQFRGGRVEIIGRMWSEISNAEDGQVVNLEENFRSTERIINLANRWASTISQIGDVETSDMTHGNLDRVDYDSSHIGVSRFNSREDEANWIAETINQLISQNQGARHNQRDDDDRGISFSDIAILLRSSTDARLYMRTLEENSIPAIFRAGPDLFSQPEILLIIATYSIAANIDRFYGAEHNPKSLPSRIRNTLSCEPEPHIVIPAAVQALQNANLPISENLADRLITAAEYIKQRMVDATTFSNQEVEHFHCSDLRRWLMNPRPLRRVFHQKIYHMLLSEAGVEQWDLPNGRGSTALFHLGALSKMLTSIETPGWTSVRDFKYQVIALLQHGSEMGKTEEAPLLVSPDAVTITTIHAAKGLEFPVVFLADVCARRFPSSNARRAKTFPFDGNILNQIDITALSDNDNYDSERRLMYVALTRAERYLFITASGRQLSRFYRTITDLVREIGGVVEPEANNFPSNIDLLPMSYSRDLRLSTSFSDLRYFLECPHDFYLRKVMGFAPTIDQAFGYGKGVHNLLRAVHSDPQKWAELTEQGEDALVNEIQTLIDRGLFYLRYTTGTPAENMRSAGLRAVSQYIRVYVDELMRLEFEPEKEFETLLEEEQVLVSGAIDVIRLDDPPRVTLIDFKSGNADNENVSGLDEEEMRLQISLYGHAAIQELEYEPEEGLVRYLGELDPDRMQKQIHLDQESIEEARQSALEMVRAIKDRNFFEGPTDRNRDRCESCDFNSFCGLPEAVTFRNND